MKSFKAVHFLNKKKKSNEYLSRIAKLFSETPNYYISKEQDIALFEFSIEHFSLNVNELMSEYKNDFSFLIISNYKIINLIKESSEFDLEFLSAKFSTFGNELEEEYEIDLNNLIEKGNLEKLDITLENNRILFKRCSFWLAKGFEIDLFQSGLIYTNVTEKQDIDKVVMGIARFLFYGNKS